MYRGAGEGAYCFYGKRKEYAFIMSKGKKSKKPCDRNNMTPEEQLKFEIAEELGLGDKVLESGWKSLTSKESGRIGGMITKRKREMQKESEK